MESARRLNSGKFGRNPRRLQRIGLGKLKA
jgi:hypothetical protein